MADTADIQEKSLHSLELDKVLALLAQEAVSASGKAACLALRPSHSREEVAARLAETDDCLQEILRNGELPMAPFADLQGLLALLRAGSVPGPAPFLQVLRQLHLVNRLRGRLEAKSGEGGEEALLWQRIRALHSLPDLASRIDEVILNEEELKDRASPTLYRLRRQIASCQEEVRKSLEAILRKQAGQLQDQVITLRGDRYVIPVKAENKASVPGIVHDASASGATVFIEPMAVVELNNRIRTLRAEEKTEIERILAELADLTDGQAAALKENQKILTDLDLSQAKARLARRQKAQLPELNEEGRIFFRQARHPLIEAHKVVPIDLELGGRFRTLIITGPNTGGKTVSLKTCGLLSLMAMCGLLLPVAAGSTVSVWQRVLADIGDEQSIEQSLSTFSSHMVNLIAISQLAAPGVLILSDELGAGTDPSEGAALAIALLETWQEQGASALVSTHYQELKTYAMTTPAVMNASCEFDTATLRPTYRLLIGVPGVSNALVISQRLGLPEDIIQRARQHMADADKRFEELLAAIEHSHREARRMEEHLASLEAQAEATRQANEAEKRRLHAERRQMLEKARQEAYEVLGEAEEKARDALRQIQTEGRSSKEREQARQSLREGRQTLEKEMTRQTIQAGIDKPLTADDIELGATYRDVLSGFVGQARETADAHGQLLLASGSLQLRVDLAQLRPVETAPAVSARGGKKAWQERLATGLARPPRSRSGKSTAAPAAALPGRGQAGGELYLLGKRVEEALQILERYLDESQRFGLQHVRIVHGKGTGALRQAVRDALKRDKRVKSFGDAAFGAGDAGVTEVELKS